MPRHAVTLCLMAMLASLVAGCGSDDDATTASTLSGKALAASLLNPRRLPNGARPVPGLPATLCAPQPILTGNGGEIAESKMFAFGHVRVQEAIADFSSERDADNAFRELTSDERRECIGGAVSSFGANGNHVEYASVEKLDLGDEGTVFPYVVVHPGTGPVSGLDVVSVRADSRVATLAFISNTGASTDGVVRDVSRIATGALVGAH